MVRFSESNHEKVMYYLNIINKTKYSYVIGWMFMSKHPMFLMKTTFLSMASQYRSLGSNSEQLMWNL
jgi:hypothetical protein